MSGGVLRGGGGGREGGGGDLFNLLVCMHKQNAVNYWEYNKQNRTISQYFMISGFLVSDHVVHIDIAVSEKGSLHWYFFSEK